MPKPHWEKIYTEKQADAVSWFQPRAETSLAMIAAAGIAKEDAVIDVGGGASRLVDDLVGQGYSDVTVLDISAAALEVSQQRLPNVNVKWLEADITQADLPSAHYALWHDRAVFHFLTEAPLRRKYVEAARAALKPRGHIVIATFAEDGPETCSGLPVVRYSPENLLAEFGGGFDMLDTRRETHKTPFGTEQKFIYCRFRLKANFC